MKGDDGEQDTKERDIDWREEKERVI